MPQTISRTLTLRLFLEKRNKKVRKKSIPATETPLYIITSCPEEECFFTIKISVVIKIDKKTN